MAVPAGPVKEVDYEVRNSPYPSPYPYRPGLPSRVYPSDGVAGPYRPYGPAYTPYGPEYTPYGPVYGSGPYAPPIFPGGFLTKLKEILYALLDSGYPYPYPGVPRSPYGYDTKTEIKYKP